VAEELRKKLAVPVELVDGGRGELTVSVGDRQVFRKLDKLPDLNVIVDAVRNAEPVGAR